jgi:tetratricopeptide (TPR) repeat protein
MKGKQVYNEKENKFTIKSRHAQYYFGIMNRAAKIYNQGENYILTGLDLFDQERQQIDAAWEWIFNVDQSPVIDELLSIYGGTTSEITDIRYDMESEQIPRLEYCRQAAKRTNNKLNESKIINKLANCNYAIGRINKAIILHEESLELSTLLDDLQGQAASLGNIGLCYAAHGDFPRAIQYYVQALPIKRLVNDRKGQAQTVCNLGIAYRRTGKLKLGMLYHFQQRAIAHEVGAKSTEGLALGCLGICYLELGMPKVALQFHYQHLEISREIRDRRNESAVLTNIASVLLELGEKEQALENIRQCLIIKQEIKDTIGEATALNNIGEIYFMLGDNDTAIEYFDYSLKIKEESKNHMGIAYTSWQKGLALAQKKEIENAIILMDKYVQYLTSINHPKVDEYKEKMQLIRHS